MFKNKLSYKEEPVMLQYRLWIHDSEADEIALAKQWDSYNQATGKETVSDDIHQ